MQIFITNSVITLSSLPRLDQKSTSRTFALEVPQDYLTSELKALIEAKTGLDRRAQRLTHGSKDLQDSDRLSDRGITKEATITLLLRLHGGSTRELRSQRRDRRADLVARLRTARQRVDQLHRQEDHLNEQLAQARISQEALAGQLARMQKTMIWNNEQQDAVDDVTRRNRRAREEMAVLTMQKEEVERGLLEAEAKVETLETAIEDMDDEVRPFV